MNQQPEALRLADALEWDNTHDLRVQAAAALRRLHEENSKLRREVAAISANAVDDGRAISKLEAQLGEAVWNYGEVKRVNAQLGKALDTCEAFLLSAGLESSDAYAEVCSALAAAKENQ